MAGAVIAGRRPTERGSGRARAVMERLRAVERRLRKGAEPWLLTISVALRRALKSTERAAALCPEAFGGERRGENLAEIPTSMGDLVVVARGGEPALYAGADLVRSALREVERWAGPEALEAEAAIATMVPLEYFLWRGWHDVLAKLLRELLERAGLGELLEEPADLGPGEPYRGVISNAVLSSLEHLREALFGRRAHGLPWSLYHLADACGMMASRLDALGDRRAVPETVSAVLGLAARIDSRPGPWRGAFRPWLAWPLSYGLRPRLRATSRELMKGVSEPDEPLAPAGAPPERLLEPLLPALEGLASLADQLSARLLNLARRRAREWGSLARAAEALDALLA